MPDYAQLAAIRLGFGLSPRGAGPGNPAAMAASVTAAAADPAALSQDQVREWHAEGRVLQREARQGQGDEATRKPDRQHRQRMRGLFEAALVDRFARAVDDPSGFGERLAGFWANHFTVGGGALYDNLMAASFINDAIRPHLAGRFADMMFAAETHPAMLRYLDQVRSVGPNSVLAMREPEKPMGLNENLAREMLELHSLGVGADYTQSDIEELARLLTGLTYDPRQPGIFRPARAEPGAETVLGTRYGGDRPRLDDIRAVIDDLAAHPATARHLARKMAVHFVADDPPPALVDRLTDTFTRSGGDLAAMNLTLAQAPELETHFRAKMRQPFEFLAASLRSLGVEGATLRALSPRDRATILLQPLQVMGQPFARPPGPDGWPEDALAWASPQGLAMRITWALKQPARLVDPLPDARDFMHVALGDTLSDVVAWAIPRAESQREGIALVLASTDFNRR